MLNKIKNITAYFLLFLGISIGIKTIPSVINRILNDLNIKNTISIDITNCQTIGYSIMSNQFFYALFLFAFLCILVSLVLLFRKQKLTFKYNYFNLGFFVIFLILILQSIALLSHIFLLMLEDSLFNTHIIYNIAFVIGLFTNLLFLTLYLLIWFDATFDNKTKLVYLLILCCFSTHICVKILTFIDLYGISNKDAGLNSEVFFDVFDYIITKLGLSVLCMDENNLCKDLLINMNKVCDLSRDVNSIPRVPYVGGSFTLRWIARIMNAGVKISKYDKQQDCNKARQQYTNCMNMFYAENNKKRRNN